jgi:hypothetical protein
MAYFQTKNPNLGKFLRVLQWKMIVNFMAIWNILWPFGLFYGYLVYFSRIGMLYQEKSGNPGAIHYDFLDCPLHFDLMVTISQNAHSKQPDFDFYNICHFADSTPPTL